MTGEMFEVFQNMNCGNPNEKWAHSIFLNDLTFRAHTFDQVIL